MKKLLLALAAVLLMLPVSAVNPHIYRTEENKHEFFLEGDFCYNHYINFHLPEGFELANPISTEDQDTNHITNISFHNGELPFCYISISTEDEDEYDPERIDWDSIREEILDIEVNKNSYIEIKEYHGKRYVKFTTLQDPIKKATSIDMVGFPCSGIVIRITAIIDDFSIDLLNEFEDFLYSIQYTNMKRYHLNPLL